MNFVDCINRTVREGARVGIAFSYSRASVGYIRIGTVESLKPFFVRWEESDKLSKEMVYSSSRVVVLD